MLSLLGVVVYQKNLVSILYIVVTVTVARFDFGMRKFIHDIVCLECDSVLLVSVRQKVDCFETLDKNVP